ncbi:PTS sugar transporter subunit IIA [Trichococcus collinsii]|uniref:PTS system, N-acetylgalactosamine-specific IIA component n=1 Tax=Trichococcus collinsii TaxID=157076 RepID=A0AB38A1P2_9LACT|nr:PTS sugar transporter [Trichococcus collinsii]CZQ95920.1 phosphotransferase system mannose-type iia component [Trichococcus collinsii]SEA67442.1 PTS system, N-acetylgalactosamine-specific IIA component [Trichococcus collinsii]
MYKIAIVGHGNFPEGVLSALSLLIGENENVVAYNLNDERTHEVLEQDVTALLKDNEQVIIFADLTGGAPHQISARVMLENKFSENQYVISGINLGLVVELTMKFLYSEIKDEEAAAAIQEAIEQSRGMIMSMQSGMV